MQQQFGTRIAEVIEGDISQVQADALITAINSGGMWFGGIDGVIQQCASGVFHVQVQAALPLKHLDTVVTKSKPHRGAFRDVVFVIDDLQGPLHEVIYCALDAAASAGYRTVSIPAIRTGVMLGAFEKDAKQAVGELLRGIDDYFTRNPETSIQKFTFVIFRQNDVLREMTAQLQEMFAN